jgi:hypothetical protein
MLEPALAMQIWVFCAPQPWLPDAARLMSKVWFGPRAGRWELP